MTEKINIEKSIKNFIYYLEFEENKKNNTVISIRKDLNNFLEYLNKKNLVTLDKLDELVIKEYLTELKVADLSNSTYNRRLSSIKKFYKYLINNNLKEKGKEILIEGIKSDEKKLEYLNLLREEMKEESFNILRDRLMFELLYSSGMTVAELLSLGELNFNLEKREVYLLKNKISKVLYFSQTCKEVYLKFLVAKKEKFKEEDNSNIIFVNNSNMRLTDRSIRRLINKYSEKANLQKEVSPYTLRHSFCLYMLKNGMPKEYLAKLLNLKSIGLLDIYEDLVALKEPPLKIMILITRQFNQLLQIKELIAAGFNEKDIISNMKLNPYVVKNLMRQARGFDMAMLLSYVKNAIELEEAIKQGNINDKLALEMLMLTR